MQKTISPIDGEIYIQREHATGKEIEDCLAKAQQASTFWKNLPLKERIILLSKMVDQFVANKEEICALISYKEGIAPPILGFAALTTNGKILLMQNTSPLNIGDKFIFQTQIADREDFVSLNVLSGEEGEKTFYLAITADGHHYYSEDLKEWTHQGQDPF